MPTRRSILSGALVGALSPLVGCTAAPGAPALATAWPGSATLRAYGSENELAQALDRWRGEAQKRQAERRREMAPASSALSGPMAAPAAPASPTPMAKSVADAGSASAAESITNVQTAGVDEGGIVKQAGDFLIVLRRGRLFTVRIGGDSLVPASMSDAYGPDVNPQGAWYDELLISGTTVVVVGYSYARGGTEIGLFELGADGTLAHRATYHLRSFDYYSSRNYASRLIGRKLIFYSPTLLQPYGAHPMQMLPGTRRWQGSDAASPFQRILPATRIYRSDDDFDPGQPLALHTVTICDLEGASMRCESTAVLGPAGRVFYVSQGSVYVWTSTIRRFPPGPSVRADAPGTPQSAVFRIPLDGRAPTGLKTAGVPIDQMSFLEDDSAHLNVLVRESGGGEGMWGSERSRGAIALMRVPLSAFGDGRGAAQREHYRVLPAPSGASLQNRFIGDWLLWGASNGRFSGAGEAARAQAFAVRYASGAEPVALSPGHAVERIEALGGDAVLVGNAGADLNFSSVKLGRTGAALAGRHVRPGASQGESRTHGFFYRPSGPDGGLLGLPVLAPAAARRPGVFADAQGAAAVVYLRVRDLEFTPIGELQARPGSARDDACKASCVDWYGNARPIFLGARVFALLGYELVEGRLSGSGPREQIEERRRISFSPVAQREGGRYSPFGN
ncbi:MAG TPA: beta-propeller domain-containing protein [Burkholderiaceae bacterium]|jgi:hypothetical protein|nr:beta-propeller domain-containing protein [Burkholderiaceae bacterium]